MGNQTYTEEIIKQRLDELLKTPRMYYIPLSSEENTTQGLLDLVMEHISNEDLVVEVGCFSGVSSRIFALKCRELHCVDPYSWPAVFEAEKMFESILPDYPNIKKIKMTSVQASKMYEDNSIDFVYIDADHSYQSVIEDIESWSPKVKKGGHLGGHDIYMSDVRKAVEEKFGKDFKIYPDTSWVVKL